MVPTAHNSPEEASPTGKWDSCPVHRQSRCNFRQPMSLQLSRRTLGLSKVMLRSPDNPNTSSSPAVTLLQDLLTGCLKRGPTNASPKLSYSAVYIPFGSIFPLGWWLIDLKQQDNIILTTLITSCRGELRAGSEGKGKVEMVLPEHPLSHNIPKLAAGAPARLLGKAGEINCKYSSFCTGSFWLEIKVTLAASGLF